MAVDFYVFKIKIVVYYMIQLTHSDDCHEKSHCYGEQYRMLAEECAAQGEE